MILLVMYRVDFYTLPNGKSPIREFIVKAGKTLKTKIVRQIEHLQEFGLSAANPYLRKISGTPVWEVRILGKDSTRIVCIGLRGERIVILDIFKKKSNKTPRGEINTSLKRLKALDK